MLTYEFPYTNIDCEQALHYYYNGVFYKSKYAALEACFNNGITDPVDAINNITATINKFLAPFSDIDCTKEPLESWEELCRDRALYLRDTYSNISLAFGGGSDCYHILNIFIKYKIKLDRIILVRDDFDIIDIGGRTNDVEDLVGIPILKKLNKQFGTEVNIFNSSDLFQDPTHFYQQMAERDLFKKGERLLPNPRNSIIGTIGLRTESVVIRGATEPFVRLDPKTGRFYFQINDTDNFLGGHQFDNSVAFFTDPRFPKIHLKQCHMMKNYLREKNLFSIDYIHDFISYKKLMMRLVRNVPSNILKLYEKSYFFDKTILRHSPNIHPLLRSVLRSRNKVYLDFLYKNDKYSFDKLFSCLNFKVDKFPAYNFSSNSVIVKKYIE